MAWGRQPPVVRRERDGVLPGLIVLQPGSGQESRSRRPEAVNCRDGSGIPRWRKDGREVTHRRKGLDASASNAKSQDAARRQAAQDKPRPRPRHLAIGTLKHLLAGGLHALARTARRGASALCVLGERMTAAPVLVGCGIHRDNSRCGQLPEPACAEPNPAHWGRRPHLLRPPLGPDEDEVNRESNRSQHCENAASYRHCPKIPDCVCHR